MSYDLIVVGGGHAGVEAAAIAAKRLKKVLLVTSHIDLIGQMSCNPAIGGIAKGNIVREVDALGGIMGICADKAGIHFKMLNVSKGPAVWGNRAQADKRRYRLKIREVLDSRKNLFLFQGMVTALLAEKDRVTGIIMDSGEKIRANAVILAMGTFLNGIAHIGLDSFSCGRSGEPPSLKLTGSIVSLGITHGRLKTGTPPRIDGRTVDFSRMKEQKGDENPWPFSFIGEEKISNQISCWITKTNSKTHQIIRDNLDRSPLYTGKITSIGPKYCPSIEDKIMRFGERDGHTLFLEPEGVDLNEMYLNGLPTSLPFDTQRKMVQSIAGLETAQITRAGYAIEYDYFQPLQLKPTLESEKINNLYLVGQINGTSGYEEAAGQGIVAGINACEKLLGGEPLILGRDSSYIGVLVDDLVTKGTDEPYRMFTSRAEHRLLLRQDNADERLTPLAAARGFIDKKEFETRKRFWDECSRIRETIGKIRITPQVWKNHNKEPQLEHALPADQLLKRPDVSLEDVEEMTGKHIGNRDIKLKIYADIKYSGFIEKQKNEIARNRRMETTEIPENFDYGKISGLLTESREKMKKIKPGTLGQAGRIPGVTPVDISIIALHILKDKNDVSHETTGKNV